MIEYTDAKNILQRCNALKTTDYHVLPMFSQILLAEEAKAYKYRKPKNANGSLGRYFFEYLRRIIDRAEK